MRGLAWLLVGGLVAVAALGGYLVGAARHRHGPPPAYLVGTVGNETLNSGELDQVLRAGLPAGVERLVQERIVLQEAKKRGIAPPEKGFATIAPSEDPSGYRRALQQSFKYQWFLRELLLQDVKEEEKRHIYDTFQAQLTRYEVSVILVANEQEATFIREDLKAGVEFDKLSKTHAQEGPPGTTGRLGLMTGTGVLERLGPKAYLTVVKMKPQSLSKPIASSNGLALIHLGKILSSYEDLKPAVEDIIAASRQRALLRQLRQGPQVTLNYKMLPFLDPRGTATPSPSSSPLEVATPSPTATPQ